MDTFYTITSSKTEFTNSRSKRFSTLESAVKEATSRLVSGFVEGDAFIILQSVKTVRLCSPVVFVPPVVVENFPDRVLSYVNKAL